MTPQKQTKREQNTKHYKLKLYKLQNIHALQKKHWLMFVLFELGRASGLKRWRVRSPDSLEDALEREALRREWRERERADAEFGRTFQV